MRGVFSETHLDRAADIERAACELSLAQTWRAEYLARHAGPTASKKQRSRALARIDPEVSDAAYRLLDLRLSFLDEDDSENYVGTEREAALLNRSVASIERASLPLEGRYQTSRRRRNKTTVRTFDVSEQVNEAARELVNLLQTAKVRLEDRETANLQSRNRKNEQLVILSETITAGQATSADIAGLTSKLTEACGEAIKDPALYPGLQNVHEVLGWLNAGCDLDFDILPILRRLSKAKLDKGKRRSITTWRFFRDAVIDARDARLALKTASAAKGAFVSPRVSQYESQEQRRERDRKEKELAFTRSQHGKGRALPAEDGQIDMGAAR